MRNRLLILADTLSNSYWFVPGLMAALAILASILTIELDKSFGRDVAWIMGLVYVDSPEGARAVLSTIASSMITVAGTVFSLTMVVLSLTSQQYGPLVLYQFMRDRGNQYVLGIFTATFIYCLLVLRTIKGVEDSIFVPHISVLLGLMLAVTSLALLIYFIHHVAESIQSNNIISRLGDNLNDAIDELFPTRMGRDPENEEMPLPECITRRLEADGVPICVERSGYIQMIDEKRLLKLACEHDVIVQIQAHPGHFLIKGMPLGYVFPTEESDEHVTEALADAFIFGDRRTQYQDIEFLFTQVVSIAVRALSPGINDPFTAIMCVDRLTEALVKLLHRHSPSMYRYDEDNQMRVIVKPVSFDHLFHTSFDQIRQYGRADLKLAIHLLGSMSVLDACTENDTYHTLFSNYASAVHRVSRPEFTHEQDWHQLDHAYHIAIHPLEQSRPM